MTDTNETTGDPLHLIGVRPDLRRLSDTVSSVPPERALRLRRSFAQRGVTLLDAGGATSTAIPSLAGTRSAKTTEDHRRLCERIREESLCFARNDSRRHAPSEQTSAHVCSDEAFMRFSSLHFIVTRRAARLRARERAHEVGSGRGPAGYLARRQFGMAEVAARDFGEIVLEEPREPPARLGRRPFAPGRPSPVRSTPSPSDPRPQDH